MAVVVDLPRGARERHRGKFKGNQNLKFTLANGGMSVGKINAAVPRVFIDKMNQIRQKIISGRLKVPTTLQQ